MPKNTYEVHIVKRFILENERETTIPSTVFIRTATATKARKHVEAMPTTVSITSISVDNKIKNPIEV